MQTKTQTPTKMQMQTKLDDGDILVCVKPAGVLSQSSEGKGGITVQDEYPDRQLFTVHRLDRETGGLMVFGENPRAASELTAQITAGEIRKRYFAVIRGKPENDSGVFRDLLFRDKQKNKTFVVKRMRKGVREASLEYEVRGVSGEYTLVEILLHTGRTHQIRVQFSSRGMPLYGDGKYGGGSGELALFSHSLSLLHPRTKERMTFTALPDTEKMPWSLFGKECYAERDSESL